MCTMYQIFTLINNEKINIFFYNLIDFHSFNTNMSK